jgi:flagellar basal body rod protein FlgF
MAWALINLVEMNIPDPLGEGGEINVPPGTCVNLIVYDGISPYNPGDNLELREVSDETNIGSFIGF